MRSTIDRTRYKVNIYVKLITHIVINKLARMWPYTFNVAEVELRLSTGTTTTRGPQQYYYDRNNNNKKQTAQKQKTVISKHVTINTIRNGT